MIDQHQRKYKKRNIDCKWDKKYWWYTKSKNNKKTSKRDAEKKLIKKKKNTFWTLNQIINNPESYRLSMNWKTQLFGLFTKKSSIKHVNLAKENQTNKKGF